MTRVTIDGETYACPFAALFRPHTPAERSRMVASIGVHGVRSPVLHYLSETHGRAILDGLNRVDYALGLGLTVPMMFLGRMRDDVARTLALSLNLDRRHLTAEEQQAARGERVKRVAQARDEGASIREIARAEQVSPGQVQRDLAAASVSGDTPKPKTRPRKPPAVRARASADNLVGLVRAVLKGPQRARFEQLAQQAGVPLAGKEWPALDLIRAVLRDVAQGGASV
jgi:transposase-like protein